MATKNKGKRFAIYLIVGLCALAMVGFGAANFGTGDTAVATVGSREISARDYHSHLSQRIASLTRRRDEPVTIEVAVAEGLDQEILADLSATAAIEEETLLRGISAGPEATLAELLETQSFQALDGSLDRDAYRAILRNAGLTPRNYEETLRIGLARQVLEDAVRAAVRPPDIYTDTLYQHFGERRAFSWVKLTEEELETPIEDPTDEDLRAHFADNEEEFMLPETRRVTYAILTPEMLMDEIEPAEEDLQEAYDSRIDEFMIPERRTVERLALGDAADEARKRIDDGEITFEDLVAERELEIEDIDLGEVKEEDLGEVGAEIFAAEAGVVGPLDTELGPALFRVNEILAAEETTFEDAREQLEEELAREEAIEMIADRIDALEDLLAGGATVEELAEESEMELREVDWSSESEDEVGDYESFVDAVEAAEIDDFPELMDLDDSGGIFALRLEEVLEPRVPEFDAVRDEVEESWRLKATLDALRAQGEAIFAELDASEEEGPTAEGDAEEEEAEPAAASGTGVSDDVYGPVREDHVSADSGEEEEEGPNWLDIENFTRSDYVAGVGTKVRERILEMGDGEREIMEEGDAIWVIRIDGVQPPDDEDESSQDKWQGHLDRGARGIGSDMLDAFGDAIRAEIGLEIDHAVIRAVHVSIP